MVNAADSGPRPCPSLSQPQSSGLTDRVNPSVLRNLHRIASNAASLTGAAYATFLLSCGGDCHLVAADEVRDDEARIGTLLKDLDGQLPGSEHPIRIRDFATDSGDQGKPEHRQQPLVTSLLRVPLRLEETFYGALLLANKQDGQGFTEEDESVAAALGDAAAAALRQMCVFRHERRRHEWLRAALETTRVLLGEVNRNDALRLVTRQIREVSGADYAAIVLADSGTSEGHVSVEAIDGLGLERVDGQPIPSQGITATVIKTGEGVVSEDLPSEPDWNPPPLVATDLSVLGPGMYLPLLVGGDVLGVLTVGWLRGNPVERVGSNEVALVKMFAGQAALALQQFQAKLLVLEDRDRIGRDLRDVVIERLFAISTRLESAAGLSDRPEVRQRIGEAIGDIDQTTRGVRTAIFQLRNDGVPDDRAASEHLLDELDNARSALGFTPRLVIRGPLDRRLPLPLQHELLHAVRQALGDAATHARPSMVEVLVYMDENRLRLVVTDDGAERTGVNVPASSIAADLRARATRLGGWATIRPSDPAGTVIEWQVPLSA